MPYRYLEHEADIGLEASGADVAEGKIGVRFDANKGTPMKEWLSLSETSRLDWERLSGEAFGFVSGRNSPL